MSLLYIDSPNIKGMPIIHIQSVPSNEQDSVTIASELIAVPQNSNEYSEIINLLTQLKLRIYNMVYFQTTYIQTVNLYTERISEKKKKVSNQHCSNQDNLIVLLLQSVKQNYEYCFE
ncbi:hypothetical protein TTHERM_000637209 (macronuclear) [Tetrahymena thermophila SB210]|uniref:Uncharacterized protein n=1 Tax=Tetrahymena thermophila (strain SB210) TaxID=312017 RepID=W7X999_TETTS|nr:hypothetical protein TTHERM_000637209 [Tetrahymena thermophila SB210]EWS72963.1 hypothetical protein TTHERM_000637209 [Tetrahymena thermophila SB210]|eukprot:XP_012654496.1 hypothetical protein TTHERM_000637209 [Tetrahymena thermophila SB210]